VDQVSFARLGLPEPTPEPTTPTLTWTPQALTFPAPIGAGQLNAQFTDGQGRPLDGTITYSVATGQVLHAGDHVLTATFQSRTPGFSDATATRVVSVARATPVLRWPGVDHLTYGTPLPSAEVAPGYDGPIDGALTYGSGQQPGSVLDSGSQTLQLGFASHDPDYADTAATFSITVAKASTRLDAVFAKLKQQVTATLTDVSNNVPLAGQRVSFYFGSRSCGATTDSSGKAVCTLSAVDFATAYRTGVHVVYAGDRNHVGSDTGIASSV
jgi:hypothetical protein